MDWILLALAAYFSWGLINVIEKLISKGIKEIFSFGVLLGLGESPLLLIYLLFPVSVPEIPILFLLLIGGTLRVISYLPYVKALFKEEVTRLVPIWNTAPLFTFTMSYFLLAESFPPNFLAAFSLMLAGSVLLTMRNKISLRAGFYLMLLSTFLYSAQAIILKYASFTLDVPSILFWTAFGTFLTTLGAFTFHKNRMQISKELRSIPPKLIIPFVVLGISAVSAFTYSIWLGNTAIVMVLGGFQSVFLLALGVLLKKELEEKMDRRTMFQKAVSIALMIAGLAILYL